MRIVKQHYKPEFRISTLPFRKIIRGVALSSQGCAMPGPRRWRSCPHLRPPATAGCSWLRGSASGRFAAAPRGARYTGGFFLPAPVQSDPGRSWPAGRQASVAAVFKPPGAPGGDSGGDPAKRGRGYRPEGARQAAPLPLCRRRQAGAFRTRAGSLCH